MLRAAAPSTYILAPRSKAPLSGTPPLLPIPLHTPSPPLLPPFTNCRADVREACLPPRKWLCFAFGLGYEVGESSSAPTARPDRDFRRDYGFISTPDDEIIRDPERDVDLVMTMKQDIDEIYGRLDDAQTERLMVTSQVRSMDASDLACTEVIALRTQVVAQRSEIAKLRTADRRRQIRLTEP
ncbi:hypothetical protein Tco_0075259 [Tanacetum coccineum]